MPRRVLYAAGILLVALGTAALLNPAAIATSWNSTVRLVSSTGVLVDATNRLPVTCDDTCTGGGGGGGGGASTIADGADVAQGTTTDAAATAGGAGTSEAKLRLMTTQLNTISGAVDGLESVLGTAADSAVAQGDAGSLSAKARADSLSLYNIESHTGTIAGALSGSYFQIKLYDEAGNAVPWSAPDTGAILTPVAVTTSSTTVYAGGDSTIREVYIRNPSTSTGTVCCAQVAAAVSTSTCTHEIPPGQTFSTGRDGYTGQTRCISYSGTQTVAVGTVK